MEKRLISAVAGACLLISMSSTLFAQKLGDLQEKSIWVPANVKVDGKPAEWNNTFQAYNKATLVYYTLANDDKNLYLVVQSADRATTNKIMRGGITFTVNPSGKKKEKAGSTVTFPVVGTSDMRSLMQGMTGGPGARVDMSRMTPDDMAKRADSVMAEANKKQILALKEIKVFGLKGVTDSIISIYNEYGVKARASFNEKGVFTYELAVPLQSLALSAEGSKEFAYNIRLNGLQISGGGPPVVMVGGGQGGFGGSKAMADMMAMLSPTDLWAKYTLAKK